jgi:Ca2+-binding RTX toxin-like protein
MAIITGTNGDDKYPDGVELKGTSLADQIYGLAGHDELVGFAGDDLLEGGAGADVLWGTDGFDLASYRGSDQGVTVDLPFSYATGGHATGDQLHEIEGAIGSSFADRLYGNEQRNVFRGEGGADSLGGFGGNDRLEGSSGNDMLNGGAGNDELLGGDGNDTADFFYGEKIVRGASIAGTGVVADLAAGTATGGDLVGSDRLAGIENLHGSLYNDRLLGNAGANRLIGDEGADELVGRGGADRFVYVRTDDSTPAAPDLIRDFSHSQGDRIDLRGVDANARPEDRDQAFQFVGQKQFTAVGQVRWFQQDGATFVQANTSEATAGPELTIRIDPLVSLQETDFLL